MLSRTAELELARDEADQASRAKSAFLAAMSHEIRTPMNGVIGMIDVLHRSNLKGEQVEIVDLIRDSGFSLLGIVENILDFSKIEAGKLTLEAQPLRFGDTVEKVCGMFDHKAIEGGVRFTMFVDPAIRPRSSATKRDCARCWSTWSPTRSSSPAHAPAPDTSPCAPCSWRGRRTR